MREPFQWTASLGRWMGVPVRLHLLVILLGLFILNLEWHFAGRPMVGPGTGIATVVILLLSILIHELSHVYAARQLGGQIEEIVLLPWGGESTMYLPHDHRPQLLIHAAGPFANLMIFAIGALLLVQTGHGTLSSLIHPLQPAMLAPTMVEVSLLKIATWINAYLFLINMLPVYPLDGGKLVRSTIWAMWPNTPRLKVETWMLTLGIAIGLTMMASAWFVRNVNEGPLQPTWFFLVSMGLISIFAARWGFHRHMMVTESMSDEDIDEIVDAWNDLYDDMDELDKDEHEGVSQWLREKRHAREIEQMEEERMEEDRVDAILDKLHRQGIASLTEEERGILQRVSARYRNRRQLK